MTGYTRYVALGLSFVRIEYTTYNLLICSQVASHGVFAPFFHATKLEACRKNLKFSAIALLLQPKDKQKSKPYRFEALNLAAKNKWISVLLKVSL